MRRPTWKKTQAHKIVLQIAQDIAESFNVPAPVFACPEYRTGTDWQWRCERVEVWTKAGAAELSVDVSATFAHLYFRFDDPKRAVEVFGFGSERLNRASGKWNNYATPDCYYRNGKPSPQDSIELFRHHLQNDFAKVAEPNPDPDEVAAWREAKRIRLDAWRKNMVEIVAAHERVEAVVADATEKAIQQFLDSTTRI